MKHPGLVITQTRNGKGICAARDFEPEETLFEVTGAFVAGDEEDDMDETTRANTFRYSSDLYISPSGSIGDFQNHSCEPNAKVEKRGKQLFVVAAEAIKKGGEALIDYSTIIAADDSWEMTCNCGSKLCRHTIKSFDTLPAALRKKYVARGMVPAYILRISA